MSWAATEKSDTYFTKESFIISIDHKTRHNPVNFEDGFTVTNNKSFLPVFCGGFGLSFFNSATLEVRGGVSNLGEIYESPKQVELDKLDSQPKKYLAGS